MKSLEKLVYMRQMPSNLIAFSSPKGKELFQQGLADKTMECYFPLSEQFITQLHPTTCGATTLVMVLNALKVDPEVQWKGIWRWYTEENLHGLTSEHLSNGIDLDGFQHIAQHNKLQIQTFYHPDLYNISQTPLQSNYNCRQRCQKIRNIHLTSAYSTFRLCLEATSRNDKFYMVINNSRKQLGQTGDGHFCPVGGINLKNELALLFDVARFKYPPQWCSFELLYKSMAPIDLDTNMPRGFSLITNSQDYPQINISRDIQSHSLAVAMVNYLFIVLQRINQGITKIQSNDFFNILQLESDIEPVEAINQVSKIIQLFQLIQDFTKQYPDLLRTICCLLLNVVKGFTFQHSELKEETEILKMNIGI